MTGRELFDINQELGASFAFPGKSWDDLSVEEKSDFDLLAFEQDLRDRPLPARLRELEKGGSYALSN